eukprot:TRINITY_DN15436_c0_g1_i2.p2 TRINITY_DN15436_c0_g1~~TRINITY_DN15436_c0_g1_i2.p2  ORF type:complete len:104 (+),score=12.10 TRINITY_DN15436_c0_g1_i2:114-425(+)
MSKLRGMFADLPSDGPTPEHDGSRFEDMFNQFRWSSSQGDRESHVHKRLAEVLAMLAGRAKFDAAVEAARWESFQERAGSPAAITLEDVPFPSSCRGISQRDF